MDSKIALASDFIWEIFEWLEGVMTRHGVDLDNLSENGILSSEECDEFAKILGVLIEGVCQDSN